MPFSPSSLIEPKATSCPLQGTHGETLTQREQQSSTWPYSTKCQGTRTKARHSGQERKDTITPASPWPLDKNSGAPQAATKNETHLSQGNPKSDRRTSSPTSRNYKPSSHPKRPTFSNAWHQKPSRRRKAKKKCATIASQQPTNSSHKVEERTGKASGHHTMTPRSEQPIARYVS